MQLWQLVQTFPASLHALILAGVADLADARMRFERSDGGPARRTAAVASRRVTAVTVSRDFNVLMTGLN